MYAGLSKNLSDLWSPLHDDFPSTIEFVDDVAPDYVTSITCPTTTSAEFKVDMDINTELFEKLTGCNLGPTAGSSFTITGAIPVTVPVRTHKKKRINKKWAKRYGYKIVFRNFEIDNVYFDNPDGPDFEFTGSNITFS